MSDSTPPKNEPEKPGDALAEKAKSAYQWWDNLATLNADDPLWMGALKIGVRVLGVLILLALSPLILLGVMLAFIAVA
ncbi:hypothetical protein FUA23_20020 [Neolewinella aurantiaca]|uniref:Uncharacterized protein n=1 Tax=Neolewinella aurantiaca TaxID=2602767 RepID=A0A5C7FMN5_9BACT|nr:hypothetical protein [Neolewinella aurantiaca]TXF86025.1 hypothetical protein FUA23_20020 [Neolewinella aurantiaca]